jgi:hypothetical protein
LSTEKAIFHTICYCEQGLSRGFENIDCFFPPILPLNFIWTVFSANFAGKFFNDSCSFFCNLAPVDVPLDRPQCLDHYSSSDQRPKFGVVRGDDVNVTCTLRSNPPVTKFRWWFNSAGKATEIRDGGNHHILLIKVYTTFSCFFSRKLPTKSKCRFKELFDTVSKSCVCSNFSAKEQNAAC